MFGLYYKRVGSHQSKQWRKSALYGALKQLVDNHLAMFPWLNVTKIKNHLRKLAVPKTNDSTLKDLEMEVAFTMAGMSLLTDDFSSSSPEQIDMIIFSSLSNSTAQNTTTARPNSASKGTSVKNSTAEQEQQSVDKGLGGHPKGTAAAFSVELSKRIMLIKEEAAAAQYINLRADAKRNNKKVDKGTLTCVLKKVREKHSIPREVKILNSTI